jgi:hypothetical protein
MGRFSSDMNGTTVRVSHVNMLQRQRNVRSPAADRL